MSWADPAMASAAQEAGAAAKLVDAGIVTPGQAAQKLGQPATEGSTAA